jgi:hypothetical protein
LLSFCSFYSLFAFLAGSALAKFAGGVAHGPGPRFLVSVREIDVDVCAHNYTDFHVLIGISVCIQSNLTHFL